MRYFALQQLLRKKLSFLTKIAILFPLLALLYGCDNGPDRTLAPPQDARWVNVTFRVPEGTSLLPLEVLYRSERCKGVRYNSNNQPHDIPGYSDFELPFSQQRDDTFRKLRVAVDGGGACRWQLNSLRVSFKVADNVALVQGKKNIESSYIVDFGDHGLSDGYGTGKAKQVSGDLILETDFFPVVTHHLDNDVDLSLFGGDTGYEQWRRRFKLTDSLSIHIAPRIHFNKIVVLTPPVLRPGNLTATYPDGSSESIPHIYPDYEKLLSMK